jgi:hypothetical protein
MACVWAFERKEESLHRQREALAVGTLESVPFPKIAIVEGAPDLLAAFHFIIAENKVNTVAPVAVLGAGNHSVDPTALAHFRGKEVCLFPHLDDDGHAAVREWAKQMIHAGARRVMAFDLSGLVLADGSSGKDLADVCRIDPSCFEVSRKFWELLP